MAFSINIFEYLFAPGTIISNTFFAIFFFQSEYISLHRKISLQKYLFQTDWECQALYRIHMTRDKCLFDVGRM